MTLLLNICLIGNIELKLFINSYLISIASFGLNFQKGNLHKLVAFFLSYDQFDQTKIQSN